MRRASTFATIWVAVLLATVLFLAPVHDARGSKFQEQLNLRAPEPKQQHRVLEEDRDLGIPEQIHIALADPRPGDLYAMSVSWLTWGEAKSQVFWGLEAEGLDHVAIGNFTSEQVVVAASFACASSYVFWVRFESKIHCVVPRPIASYTGQRKSFRRPPREALACIEYVHVESFLAKSVLV